MTNEELIKLEKFEAHVHLLMERYQQLKAEYLELEARFTQREQEIATLKEQYADSQKQYENLKLAKIISINDIELESAKKRLAKLVRDVDKCIALLNT